MPRLHFVTRNLTNRESRSCASEKSVDSIVSLFAHWTVAYGDPQREFLCRFKCDTVRDCRLLFVVHVLCMSEPLFQSPHLCHCLRRDPDNICPPPDASFAIFPHPALLCSKTSEDPTLEPKADHNERQHSPASDQNNRSLPEKLPRPLRYADGLLLPHLHASKRMLLRHLPE